MSLLSQEVHPRSLARRVPVISGVVRQLWLWRAALPLAAVGHKGEVLESFVTKAQDKKAALKFLRKAMRKHGRPEVIVTDRLRSYGAALREIGVADRHKTGR
ncbi:DDE-type integrase/transposase/recombinase [Limibacillus sp. MBR-115]|jgi:putative transposase|uniref:DDE-type integrase/transposase/recombinase n=1 Tax=Limibacillus sp. MBR-115 TaxID=3156465 RepID=UPI00339B5CA1